MSSFRQTLQSVEWIHGEGGPRYLGLAMQFLIAIIMFATCKM